VKKTNSSSVLDRDVVVVHSSDIHVDDDYTARMHGGDGTAGLRSVLETARALAADVVVLAGDVFEHNRLPAALLERTARMLTEAETRIVILPGNHDPLVPESVYHRGGFDGHRHVHILGVTDGDAVLLPELDLEIWGRAHANYDDMAPLGKAPTRRTRWQIAVAHGHSTPKPDRSAKAQPSWLIHDRHLAASRADYVALGHWNLPARVGPATIEAHYSGCPELAGTVNLVRLGHRGTVSVSCEPIRWKRAPVDIDALTAAP